MNYNEINNAGVMMKIELDNMIIEYNNCDLDYIEFLIDSLKERSIEILNFFEFEKMKPKVRIRLWPDLEKFREFASNCFQKKVSDSTCGFARKEDDILIVEVLSLQILRQLKYHEHQTIHDLVDLILHEFVHACHYKLSDENSYAWLFEGLATFLSHQYNNIEYNFTVSLEDIAFEHNIDYRIFYTMFSYVYQNYGKNYIFKLLNNFRLQEQDTPKLYEETKEFIEQIKNKR